MLHIRSARRTAAILADICDVATLATLRSIQMHYRVATKSLISANF